MPNPSFGLKQGDASVVRLPVAASQTIYHNDPLTLGTGGVARAAAGEKVYGYACNAVTSGSTAGVVFVDVDVSPETIRRFKSTGALTVDAHLFHKCDFGGYASDGTPQIDHNSATNGDLYIVGVDADLDVALVLTRPVATAVS